MTSRKRTSWVAPLPTSAKAGSVSHRFPIAGRAAAQPGMRDDRPAADALDDPGMVSAAMRQRMVRRLAEAGITDAAVLDAMVAVQRHVFVDAALASRAYEDTALPIGHGQTISQPYIVARMIELLRVGGPLGRVLEIGTGCGYQAAVLGRVAGMVYSIERVKALHDRAKAHLRPLRMANVRLHFGDGMLGLPIEAPFDGIIVAAAGLGVPEALLTQLTLGGRLLAPLAASDGAQRLVRIERVTNTQWKRQEMDGVHFVPLLPGTV